jgi:Ca2+-transporting ATPase
MAERGLRILAVAVAPTRTDQPATLIGLIGIPDPPRTEAIEAVAAARAAGITTVMITGDHPLTARAIARELGIVSSRDVEAEVVHARATPEDKIRIVREWKARGAVVAMTGDGSGLCADVAGGPWPRDGHRDLEARSPTRASQRRRP